ncbi:FNTB farnesyltransferase, partial [Todus mexicanus]|nr:FNTB farnesyltransferase [Todus mexicanus]
RAQRRLCALPAWRPAQTKVEDIVQEVFDAYKTNHHAPQFILHREKHFHYLKRGLRQLTEAYECLDASRPWLCYWILHSLELLDEPIPQSVASDVCQFLSRCQSPQGGFGGGPGQHPHLAPTYAAVNALCIIGTEEAFGVIDRSGRRHRAGGVRPPAVGSGGARRSPLSLLCSRLSSPRSLSRSSPQFFGSSFVPPLAQPLAAVRDVPDEGFLHFPSPPQSFLHPPYPGDEALSMTHWMFDQSALQEYILLCCQCPAGGLLDKPGKSRDFYHTCYCLSGLAIAQHFGSGDLHHEVVLGVPENRLQPTHPVYNIAPEKVVRAVVHFLQQPVP